MNKHLSHYKPMIEQALAETAVAVKSLNKARQQGKTPHGGRIFDARSKLYELAMELAGYKSRAGDLAAMHVHIKPKKGEIGVDLSAGTGFLTKAINEWTNAPTFAVDPSGIQLMYLKKHCSADVVPIQAAPSDRERLFGRGKIKRESVDFVTSFGGIHHIGKDKYAAAFQNIARMLKPGGRFVAADVGAGTILQRHFDNVVATKCLTGHAMGRFMNPERLHYYCRGAGLVVVRTKMKPLTWDFDSKEEMAWFFKGLHAYPQPPAEIIQDLHNTLGFQEVDGKIKLNWPMLFWEIRKLLEMP